MTRIHTQRGRERDTHTHTRIPPNFRNFGPNHPIDRIGPHALFVACSFCRIFNDEIFLEVNIFGYIAGQKCRFPRTPLESGSRVDFLEYENSALTVIPMGRGDWIVIFDRLCNQICALSKKIRHSNFWQKIQKLGFPKKNDFRFLKKKPKTGISQKSVFPNCVFGKVRF